MFYKFSKPYTFEGKEFTEIELDLESMTGNDFVEAKKEYKIRGFENLVPTTDSEFCAVVASKLAKQPLEFFTGLPAKDYIGLTTKVMNFLLPLSV